MDAVNFANTQLTGIDIPTIHYVSELKEEGLDSPVSVDHSMNIIFVNLSVVQKNIALLKYLSFWGYFKTLNFSDSECDNESIKLLSTQEMTEILDFVENCNIQDMQRKISLLQYIQSSI